MNRQRIFIALTVLELALLAGLFWSGARAVQRRERSELPANQALVRTLGLTDLSLWTEARYTRNPSQSDHFTPFQDFPAALEHFPAGSILAPPELGDAAVSGAPRRP